MLPLEKSTIALPLRKYPSDAHDWIHCFENFFTVLILEQLALALRNRVCPEFFHCIEYTFYILDFKQLALALKTELAQNFCTVLNILFTFRIFEQLALALKTEFAPKFFKRRGLPPPFSYAYAYGYHLLWLLYQHTAPSPGRHKCEAPGICLLAQSLLRLCTCAHAICT